METVQTIFLALLQGLTEFLPISSSGHLILVPQFLGWSDQGLAFDVAVHVGTLIAVVFYFRQDLVAMTVAWFRSLRTRTLDADARLAWAVLWGTVPVGIAGLLFKDIIETSLRSPLVIMLTTAGFGVALLLADRIGSRQRDEHTVGWRDVLLVGVAQAIALIPGTSRSGITMTAGLLLGLTRAAAARYSFLLSIPVIMLAGGLQTLDLVGSDIAVAWDALALGIIVSALSAYACIRLFLRFLEQTGMLPFALYRLFLAGVIWVVFYA